MADWVDRSIFYHIYPLGFCGAPLHNDFSTSPKDRINKFYDWIPHFKRLGVNALYVGPVFESTAHGYDTADFFTVDRRLGRNDTLKELVATLHQHNIRVILDGVFHHVGRDFWAFQDLRRNMQTSKFADWFAGLCFDQPSPYGDSFTYEGWKGHYDLVKLNLKHPAVRQHLFKAVEMWIREWNVDGLRLDAADCIDKDFLKALSEHCKTINPNFWLMGEVVAGDYRDWVNATMLDSVTNYVCYKGLYSSHVDLNYFEIAYSLNRQFGCDGAYKDCLLYNFVDNHDVDRVASRLNNPAHLYPLYCLMFTIPGIPSIYYGSEWGIEGRKDSGDDAPLRPAIDLTSISQRAPHPDLVNVISRLAAIRTGSPALQKGNYKSLHVAHQQLAFSRQLGDDCIVVVLNSSETPASLELMLPHAENGILVDLLNRDNFFPVAVGGRCSVTISPSWGRILMRT